MNVPPQSRIVKKRPGFSIHNAMRFKPAFDLALDNFNDPDKPNKDVFVEYDSLPTLSSFTFGQRMAEALRYLIDYYDLVPAQMRGKYTAADYAFLRGIIKIRRAATGIHIEFPGSVTASIVDLGYKAPEMSRVNWKTKLMEYVDNGLPGKVFTMTGLMLTEEDITWVNNYLSEANIEFKVDQHHIMAIK